MEKYQNIIQKPAADPSDERSKQEERRKNKRITKNSAK